MGKENLLSEKRMSDQNGSTGRQICTRYSASSGSTTQEASGLRRSNLETPSKKFSASVSSTRESDALEKRAQMRPPIARKSKSVEELTNDTKQRKTRLTARDYRALFTRQSEKYEGLAYLQGNKHNDANRVANIGLSHNCARDFGETFARIAHEDSIEKAKSCSAHDDHAEEVNASANADEIAVASASFVECRGNPQAENLELPKVVFSETSMEKDADPQLKRNTDVVLDAPGEVSNMDVCTMIVDGTTSSPSGCKGCDHTEMCRTRVKRQRVDYDSTKLGDCSSIAEPDLESDCVALQGRVAAEAAVVMGFEENNDQNAQQDASLDCKSDSSRFAEYWVPVQMSNIQLEQYCQTLLSKSLFLCSFSKNDPVGVLRDTLLSVRKTCDHPYLVDASLISLLTKNLQEIEYLDVDIKASGKLQLLDAMLTEIRKRGSKVVVLYQKIGCEKSKIGDFLDDVVRGRFGPTSYERVECDIPSSKKQNALNKFNNESGRFVLLMEMRACNLTIKLSSVEAFILFDSSWCPSNDLRALQKIKVELEPDRTKVFRLYSTCTIEEKILILARQNKTVDCRENLNLATIHALLMWGPTYLFDKMDHFHNDPTLYSGAFSEQSIMADVFHDFLSILSSEGGEKNRVKQSLILEARHFLGTYSTDSPLFGEGKVMLSDESNPNIFWTKLLEGKNPRWKYCSVSSQRNRKRPQYSKDFERDPEVDNQGALKKRKKGVGDSSDLPSRHDEEKAWRKGNEGALEPPLLSAVRPSPRSFNDTLSSLGSYFLGGNISVIPEDMLVGNDGQRRLHESRKCLHADLRSEITKLCRVLLLSEALAGKVEKLLEYVINNHHVCREPTTILQAFQIAMCWTAASLLKKKINHKESLALAKDHLMFGCSREEVEYIYSMLCCMKSVFVECIHRPKLDSLPNTSEKSSSSIGSVEVQECATEWGCSQYALVEVDIANAVREIRRKYSKQLAKLLEKHEEEKNEIKTNYAKELYELENKKKVEAAVIRICVSTHSRVEKLKKLDSEYDGKFDELKHVMEKCLEDLEQVHMAVRKKLSENEAHWIERIQGWAKVELLNRFLDKESNNKRCSGMISSNAPENASDAAGACDGPSGEVVGADINCMVLEETQECLQAIEPFPKVQSRQGTFVDGDTQPDATEMMATNHGQEEDVIVVTSPQWHLDKVATENRLDELPPLTEPGILASADCQEKAVALNSPLSEGQMCDEVTAPVPDEGISFRMPNITQPGFSPENAASAVLPSNVKQASVFMNNQASNVVSRSSAMLDQQDENMCSLNQQSSVEPTGAIESSGSAIPDQAAQNSCPPSSLAREIETKDISEAAEPLVSESVAAFESGHSNHEGEIADSDAHMDRLTSGDASHGQVDLPTDSEPSHAARSEGVSQNAETLVHCTETNHVKYAHEANVEPSAGVTEDECANLVSDFGATWEQQSEATPSVNQESPVSQLVLPPVQLATADQDTCLPLSSVGNMSTQNISDAADPRVAESDSDYVHHCIDEIRQNAETSAHEAVVQQPSASIVADQPSNTQDSGSRVNSMSLSAVQATAQIPFPFSDPFQYELERIRREMEKVEKIYNEETSQLKAECERKIAEIVAKVRHEYDSKLRHEETKYHAKTKELNSNKSYIVMNKYLAEAFITKCMDSNAPAAPPTLRDANAGFMQQPSQLRPQRLSTVLSCPSAMSTALLPTPPTSSVSRFSGPPLNSPIYPMPQARPPPPPRPLLPLITNADPSSLVTTRTLSCRVRTPAPHLQPFRLSSVPPRPLTLHPLHNSPTTLGQHVQQWPQSSSPRHNSRYGMVSDLPVSASELLMGVCSQAGPSHRVGPAASVFPSVLIRPQPQPQPQQRNPVNRAEINVSPDVICLLDDE